MQKKILLTVAIASQLLIAQSAIAKPMDFTGANWSTDCSSQSFFGGWYYAETFKPTFSVLKKATFVVRNDSALGNAYLHVELWNGANNALVAASDTQLVTDDMIDWQLLTFSFAGGVAVAPLSTYRLRLVQEDGAGYAEACAFIGDSYPDGNMYQSTSSLPSYDLAFGATGGGKPK